MPIPLSKANRTEAIGSLRRYFEANMTEPLGELAAGLLLNYFLEEIGPAIYNQAVADAQSQLTGRIADLSGELYAEEFTYWSQKRSTKR